MKPAPQHLTEDEAREMTRQMAWEYVRDLRDKVRELETRLKVLEGALKDGNRRVDHGVGNGD